MLKHLSPLVVLAFSSALSAQTVTRPISTNASDSVVLVVFYSGGQIDAKGKNIAVIDSAGAAVPYRLLANDPEGQSVIAVDLTGKATPLSLQYGTKPLANAKPDDHVQPSLVLQTFPLTRGGFRNPAEVFEFTANARAQGTALVQKIDMAYNPFAHPTQFISVFDGLLKVESDKSYHLISANDDAAFVEIDGKTVIAEPAAHMIVDPERLSRQAVEVKLAKGEHRVRYVHVQTDGATMALLGEANPKKANALSPTEFVHDEWAKLGPAISDGAKPTIGFDAEQIDQLGQGDFTFTRFALRPIAGAPAGLRYRWNFGDSTTSSAARRAPVEGEASDNTEHVFAWPVAAPTYANWKVTVELVDGKGVVAAQATSVLRPAVFKDSFTTEEAGVVEAYAKDMALSDYQKADGDLLTALYTVAAETESPPLIAPIAEPFVKRFSDRQGPLVWDMKYALATFIARDEPARAAKLYDELARTAKDSWAGTQAAAEELDLQIFRLNAKAADVTALMSQLFHDRQPRERALLRSKAGDVYRVQGKVEEATAAYREAAQENARQADAKKAAVLERAYRETALGYLQQKRYPALREQLLAWEADYPMAKLGGDLPLLTGRYFQAVGDDPRAIAEFQTILNLNPLHPSKPEIIFRLAQSLGRTGKVEEAKKLFAQVAKDYPNSPFAADASNAPIIMELGHQPGE